MKPRLTGFAVPVGLTMLVTACAQAGAATSGTAAPVAPAEMQPGRAALNGGSARMSPSPTVPAGSGMQRLVDAAIADLSRRLATPPEHITLVSADAVVWPDSSLGCPRPGMRYKQVPEDGARIVLEARGATYAYHNGGSRGLFLCEKTRPVSKTKPPQIDITNLPPRVREDDVPPAPHRDRSIPPGEDR